MSCWQITIDVRESLVFSEQSSTVGGHQALNYIPGSALLGACAAQLYNKLGTDAFTAFHSGKVQFGNAYPISPSGETAYPMPFSWHYAKGDSIKTKADFQEKVSNHSHGNSLPQGKQPKQMREGYISPALEYIKPQLEMRMKTAINPDTARAATGQLYGYQAISPGISYRAPLCISDTLSDEQRKEIEDKLTKVFTNTTLYLGRSRSAQYGRVDVSISKAEAKDAIARKTTDNTVTLWLLSDVALTETQGKQLDIPHLPEDKINWSSSFLRYRRYSPYNSTRRSYDLERNVMQKGSVIVYELDEPLTDEAIKELEAGIGYYQESGLGRIAVNPQLLSTDKPKALIQVAPENQQQTTSSVAKPNTPFIQWLTGSSEQQDQQQHDSNYAETSLKDIHRLYNSAQVYSGASSGNRTGPSKSQWGRVAEVAKEYQSTPELQNEFMVKLKAICKNDDKDWGVPAFLDDLETTFAKWLVNKLVDPSLNNAAEVAIHIARKARIIAQQYDRSKS